VHDDQVRQEIRRALVDRPTEQPWQDDRVAETGNREEFSDALQDGHNDGLEGGHALNLASSREDPEWLPLIQSLVRVLRATVPSTAEGKRKRRRGGPRRR